MDVPERGIAFRVPLRRAGHAGNEKREQNRVAIGGVKRTAKLVSKLPSLRAAGVEVGRIVERFLDEHPDTERRCLDAVGSDSPTAGPLDAGPRAENGCVAACSRRKSMAA